MSWLHTFVAVPLVGLELEPDFSIVYRYGELVAPLLNELRDSGKLLEVSPLDVGLSARSSDGLKYTFTAQKVVVEFQYFVQQAKLPGRLQETATPPELQPYRELLDRITEALRRCGALFHQAGSLRVKRIGFVATVNMERSAAPPGVVDLISHLNRPWPLPLLKCESSLLALLTKGDDYQERCHHTIQFDETAAPNDLHVRLDWQRAVRVPEKMSPKWMEKELLAARTKAVDYFESVGEGVALHE